MNKEQKKQIVKDFIEILSEPGFYLLDFKGLNVAEITELRSMLREAKVSMRVVKNTLAKRALEEAGIEKPEVLKGIFTGPTSIVWSDEKDTVTPVRVLMEFLKKHKKGTVKAGLIDGLFVKDSDLVRISELPDKKVLYTMIASSLNAPIIKLARILNSVPQKFVSVVDALREKKEGEAA